MSKFDVPCQSFCPSHWQHIVHDTALCCSFNSCCEMRMTAHKVGGVMVCSCTIFHPRNLSRCMRSMLHILSSTDKHMHHSFATMCSARRQLPASVLAAAIPKHRRRNSRHPLWLLPFRSIRLIVGHARMVLKRIESALSRHPPRTSCPAAPGGLDRHGIPRSQSRLARHASKQDLYKFRPGPRLARPHRLLAAAAACRHTPRCFRRHREAGRRSRPGQRRLTFPVCSAGSCGAANPGQYKKKNAQGCLC